MNVQTAGCFPDSAKHPVLLLSNVAGSGPEAVWLGYSSHETEIKAEKGGFCQACIGTNLEIWSWWT